MARLLLFFVFLGAVALGLAWLADHPGQVDLVWGGYRIESSAMVALGLVVALAFVIALIWGIIRFVFRIPSLVTLARRMRRRDKGMEALSRGMIAVGAGDARAAKRHAGEAHRLLRGEPLTHLLRAQAAQLAGDRVGAEAAFKDMLERAPTHALGLRGLHLEARRRGDHAAALEYAARAQKHAPLPWAGQAVLDHRAAEGDWTGALATVESNAAAQLIDKPTSSRWRAVLKTAIAQERAVREPQAALALSLEALRLAPDLVPASVLAGRLTAANGDYRRAAKIIETAYSKTPHPDLANAYLRMRPGDSASDRLTRARALARLPSYDPESCLTIARAALEARDFKASREAIAPLLGADAPACRPSVRACLLMADLEETEGGAPGAVREWLARASRAPRDKAWVADGVISDAWAPASPNGKLDAFVWRVPDERLSAPDEAPIAPTEPSPPEALTHTVEPIAEALQLPAAPEAPTTVAATVEAIAPQAERAPDPLPTPAPPDDPGAHAAPVRRFRLFS